MRLYTTNMCGIYCRLIWANLNVKDFCPQKLPIVALAYREYLLTGRTLCVKTFIDQLLKSVMHMYETIEFFVLRHVEPCQIPINIKPMAQLVPKPLTPTRSKRYILGTPHTLSVQPAVHNKCNFLTFKGICELPWILCVHQDVFTVTYISFGQLHSPTVSNN